MDKKIIFLLIILLIPIAFSQDEYIIGNGEVDPDQIDDATALQTAQQNLAQLGSISQKIDALGEANVKNLEQIAGFMDQRISSFQFSIIISLILICLSCLGIWWAIFLYLQSKRLILMGKSKKEKEEKEEKEQQKEKEINAALEKKDKQLFIFKEALEKKETELNNIKSKFENFKKMIENA